MPASSKSTRKTGNVSGLDEQKITQPNRSHPHNALFISMNKAETYRFVYSAEFFNKNFNLANMVYIKNIL